MTATARVSSDGQATQVFSFPGLAAYTGDEIRVRADGSIDLAVALPHAERTSAVRAVYPFRVSMSLPLGNRATDSNSNGGRLQALSYRSGTVCEWIPGGSIVVDGVEHKVAEGRWDCYQGWYWVPDSPDSPPIEGTIPGGGGSGGSGTVTTPTTAQTNKIADAEDKAIFRLSCMDSCESLFEPFGQSGIDVLGRTKYFNGSETPDCQAFPNRAAWTRLGTGEVYLCKGFETLSEEGAAVILIHEALRTAGLNEANCAGEAEMTSLEINRVVGANCNLQF